MAKPRAAIDHDSTLAATLETAFDLMLGPGHGYTYQDIQAWRWPLEEFGKKRFLNAVWHAWNIRPKDIDPMEPGLPETLSELSQHYEVHVVTAHPDHSGITEGKKKWLYRLGIPFDEFHVVPTDTSKSVFGYDVYIDDKPSLPEQVNQVGSGQVYLRDLPYNRDAPGRYTRVDTVEEAKNRLLKNR